LSGRRFSAWPKEKTEKKHSVWEGSRGIVDVVGGETSLLRVSLGLQRRTHSAENGIRRKRRGRSELPRVPLNLVPARMQLV